MTTVTDDDIHAAAVFMMRMMPSLLAGQSFESAGSAVLAQDRKLFVATTATNENGAFIRSELAVQIYDQVRQEEDSKRKQIQAANDINGRGGAIERIESVCQASVEKVDIK